jgi:hypothetical protein
VRQAYKPVIDWDSPIARNALIYRVGPAEYSQLFEEHRRKSAVAIVNGYRIRPIGSRFGRLFSVDGTGFAFRTQPEATAFANEQKPVIDRMIEEYEDWQLTQGLSLGSADEHLFDDDLTDNQRIWLRNFSRRWEKAEQLEYLQTA